MNKINTDELIDSHNRQPYNKLQDMFPFNSTEAGLNGVFVASNDGKSFYINTPCIVASNQTIIKDEPYLLLDLETDDHKIEESNVKVLDVFFTDGSVYILNQDIETDKKRVISLFLEHPMDNYPWLMLDLDYLQETLKSTNNHCDMLIGDNELLEFDF